MKVYGTGDTLSTPTGFHMPPGVATPYRLSQVLHPRPD